MRYIYGLVDPRFGVVRYVGFTSKTLKQRTVRHIQESVAPRSSHYRKSRWIVSIMSEGIEPTAVLLEEVPPDADWQEAERRWIKYYRDRGNDLCNHTDGGDGVLGRRWTDEERAKIMAAKAPIWADPVWRQNQRQKATGKTWTDESRRKASIALKGRTVFEETREKLSASRQRKCAKDVSCPFCQSSFLRKQGRPNGRQRYSCCDCSKFSYDALDGSQKLSNIKRQKPPESYSKSVATKKAKKICLFECPHCGSDDMRRKGVASNGKTEHYCNGCKRRTRNAIRKEMAGATGFEPATCGFGDHCSSN